MTEATLFNDSLEIEIAQLPVALISETLKLKEENDGSIMEILNS